MRKRILRFIVFLFIISPFTFPALYAHEKMEQDQITKTPGPGSWGENGIGK